MTTKPTVDESMLQRPEETPSLVIITGQSGAGKSTAMRLFEDMGYCCVDNLPPGLIFDFYSLYQKGENTTRGVVIASDVRSGELFNEFLRTVNLLAEKKISHSIVYLEASVDVLMHRFKEVRREHPLEPVFSIEDAIVEEKQRLEPIFDIADRVIDTTRMSVKELKDTVLQTVIGNNFSKAMKIKCISFGFKYGIPLDADYVFDVRFLPNPFYQKELKELSGIDAPVYDYVMEQKQSNDFFNNISTLLDMTFSSFIDVNKFSITVAFGCTGGRHRSVAFTQRLAEYYKDQNRQIVIAHRDIKN